jgi:hypothetical protein
LPLDDFKRLFAYFYMATYLKERYTYSDEEVLGTIQHSIDSSQITVDKVAFRNDLTESTCMLVRDGLDYTFSHRSFQEYFAAYFVSRVRPDEMERALPRLPRKGVFDNVLKMVAEMSKEKFEEVWALPMLNRLCNAVAGIDAQQNCVSYATVILGKPFLAGGIPRSSYEGRLVIMFDEDPTRAEITNAQIRNSLYGVYGIYDRIKSSIKDERGKDAHIIQQIRKGEILADDARFEPWRQSAEDENRIIRVELEEIDNKWLQDTYFAQFIKAEAAFLPRLRDEVAHRVSQRQVGLAEIFD